ncbi:MAG: acyl-CoA dehydrogenase [Deltaproteobacteria bacterium]|nr:acyl-CoA dehydrogenase [Deltaproteobacteria bacterium]
MNFQLSDAQAMIQQTARDFSKKQVQPKAAELDESGRFPHEIVKEMAGLGFLGMMVPEQWGGAGLDTVSYVLAMEEISRGCASTGVIMSVNNSLVCDPLMKFGNDDQKKRFLTPLAQGDLLGCFCLSEPGTGSDAASQTTTAKKSDKGYVLNGTKNWITNGKEANVAIVFAMTDKAAGHKGIAAFVVDTKSAGFSVAKLEKKLGIKASSTAQIHLDNVEVPAANMLGGEKDGFKVAMTTLDGGRIGIASQALGIARAALEDAKDYAKERKTFGTPVSEKQAIQFMFADIATELEAARLLTLRAAMMKDAGAKFSREAAMAKLYASEMAMRSTVKALQIFGGYGYVTDYPAERHMRDAKITEIYEGTSEIQRIVIAQSLLKEGLSL